jgi:hypothetical protein
LIEIFNVLLDQRAQSDPVGLAPLYPTTAKHTLAMRFHAMIFIRQMVQLCFSKEEITQTHTRTHTPTCLQCVEHDITDPSGKIPGPDFVKFLFQKHTSNKRTRKAWSCRKEEMLEMFGQKYPVAKKPRTRVQTSTEARRDPTPGVPRVISKGVSEELVRCILAAARQNPTAEERKTANTRLNLSDNPPTVGIKRS